MVDVTINFKVPTFCYSDYEDILQDFLNSMLEIGVEDVDITEKEV